jgi:hypothetical protein
MVGVMSLGEAHREAPAQGELRPTCAGAPCVNLLHLYLSAYNQGSDQPASHPEGCPFWARDQMSKLQRLPACGCAALPDPLLGSAQMNYKTRIDGMREYSETITNTTKS